MSVLIGLIGLFVFPLLGLLLFGSLRDFVLTRSHEPKDPHPRATRLAIGAGIACLVVAAVWLAWTVVPGTWESFWRWGAILVLSSVYSFEALCVAWVMVGLQSYVWGEEDDARAPREE